MFKQEKSLYSSGSFGASLNKVSIGSWVGHQSYPFSKMSIVLKGYGVENVPMENDPVRVPPKFPALETCQTWQHDSIFTLYRICALKQVIKTFNSNFILI